MESGLSLLLGTRDAALRPACARAFGVKLEPAALSATVFLPEPGSEVTLANLRDNAQIALTFSRGIDHRSLQVKGECFSVRGTSPSERAIQDRYFAEFAAGLRFLGHRPALLERVRYFPSHALSFRIESMFEQTPGPGAGRGVLTEPG